MFYSEAVLLCNCVLQFSIVVSVLKFEEVQYNISWIELFKNTFFVGTLPVAIIDHLVDSGLNMSLPTVTASTNYSFLIYSDINLIVPKASYFILGNGSTISIKDDIRTVNMFCDHYTKVVFWFVQSIPSTLEDFILSEIHNFHINSVLIVSPLDGNQYTRMVGTNNILNMNHSLWVYKVLNAKMRNTLQKLTHQWQKIENDFEGATLRVKAHPKYLMLQYNQDEGLFGVDASALYTLSQLLNFKVKIVLGIKNHFGNTFANNSLTASITDLIVGNVDMNINRHVVFAAPGVLMLPALDQEEFCFILPYYRGEYRVTSLFNVFTPTTWSALWTTLILSILVWKLFNQLTKSDGCPEMSIIQSLLSIKIFQPQKLFQRVFIFTWLTFVFVLVSALKVMMLKHLLMPYWIDDIRNMENLLASNLKIKNRIGIFQVAAPNSTLEKLLNKSVVSHLIETDEEFQTSAYFTSKYFRMFLNTALGGSHHYYTVPDCTSDLYVSYMVSTRSPYFIGLQQNIMYLQEHGFYTKWFRQFNNKSSLIREGEDSFYFGNSTKNGINRTLTVEDLMVAFYILLIGISASVLVLLGEIWTYKKSLEEELIKPFVK